MMKCKKVVILGTGNVGAETAYTLAWKESCDILVLIDAKPIRAEAEALDLKHGLFAFGKNTNIKCGTYEECADADIIIITAAARVKFGETRLDMIEKNALIMDSIIPEILRTEFSGIFLVVTNPVDVMANYIQKKYELPATRVIGTGTVLDTIRLNSILSDKLANNDRQVRGICIGEHGDSMIIPWSQIKYNESDNLFSEEEQKQILHNTIQSAYQIMKGKGNTSYGIAASIAQIVDALFSENEKSLPVSAMLNGEYGIKDVYLSHPCKLSDSKITIEKMDLTDSEITLLKSSAEILKETLDKVM